MALRNLNFRSRSEAAMTYFCGLVSLVILAITTFKGHKHFLIFTNATRELFALVNPYGKPFQGEGGYQTLWLYSPSASLFFAPFAYLPSGLGLFLYLALSLALFYASIFRWLEKGNEKKQWGSLGLFFLITASEVIGSVQAAKLELLSVALLFWAAILIVERRALAASVLMAWVASWKFQALPAVALMVVSVFCKGEKKLGSYLGAVTVVALSLFFAWPWLVFPSSFVNEIHQTWMHSLTESLDATWRGYQSLYVFTGSHFGAPVTTEGARRASLGAALLALALTVILSRRSRGVWEALLMALALGTGYSVLFSPMSQSSGYILATPLLLSVALMRNEASTKQKRDLWTLVMLAHWFLTSLLYSDVVPKSWKEWAWENNVKPLGFSLLLVFLLAAIFSRRFQKFNVTR